MPLGRYRIMRPTICLVLEEGRYKVHTIPTDTLISVKSKSEFKMFNVTWDGRAALIFALDLAWGRLQAQLVSLNFAPILAEIR